MSGGVARLVLGMISGGLLALSGCSCGDDANSLVVDVKTDLVPGVEFTRVRVVLETALPRAERRERAAGRAEAGAFRSGVRAAEIDGLEEGSHRMQVALLGPSGGPVVERAVAVEVRGNVLVTVVLTRDCRSVVCPGAGDAAGETECLGGRCVDPHCADGLDETVCGAGECDVDGDCTPAASCATGVCDGGSCLYFENAGACDADSYCDPDRGCTALGPEGDGGPGADSGSCSIASCDDGIACTADGCGAAGCMNEPDDTMCTERAGGTCDPVAGCSYPCATSADCAGGETCHEGGCLTATAFRITRLVLRDPRLDADVGMRGFCMCTDATGQLNDLIADDVAGRSVPVYVFLPLDPAAGRNDVDGYAQARCPDATSCGPGSFTPERGEAVHTTTGTTPCYAPESGTLGPYTPPNEPLPPCIRADVPRLDLAVVGTTIRLTDVTVAATLEGNMLVDGILAGFLTESAARDVDIPSDVPLCGGQTAWDMLRGGGSCRSGDDRDGAGWWVYSDFEAIEVDWTG